MNRSLNPVADVAICVVFFTRLPMVEFEARDRKLGDAIWAAPLAGFLIAIIGAFILTLASAFGVPRWPAAALALAGTMLATGCLHEDGLADVADGFGGGKTPERKLEIMHDSRLGTYGAAALMTSILIRWSALVAIGPSVDLLCALIAAHVGSRAVFAPLIRDTPLATQSGLAGTVGPVSRQSVRLALGLVALACCSSVSGARFGRLFCRRHRFRLSRPVHSTNRRPQRGHIGRRTAIRRNHHSGRGFRLLLLTLEHFDLCHSRHWMNCVQFASICRPATTQRPRRSPPAKIR
jgi:adenosylcobinamide-GDP ribazoletransferase